MAKVSDDLIQEVKNYLDITWEDEEETKKLAGQIRRGIAYITEKTGVEASVFEGEEADGRAQELLFAYLLYDRSGALDQFKRNYKNDIMGLRIREEVKRHAASAEG